MGRFGKGLVGWLVGGGGRERRKRELGVEVGTGNEVASILDLKEDKKQIENTIFSSYRGRAHHHRVGRRAGQSKHPRERVIRVEAGAVDAREDEAPRGPRCVIEENHLKKIDEVFFFSQRKMGESQLGSFRQKNKTKPEKHRPSSRWRCLLLLPGLSFSLTQRAFTEPPAPSLARTTETRRRRQRA